MCDAPFVPNIRDEGGASRKHSLDLVEADAAAIELRAKRCALAGERSLRALVAHLDARVLTELEWRPLDPAGGSLVDIDRPEDLERLAERASDRHAREVR